MADLTIILVSFNTRSELEACLASLAEHPPFTSHEVVVVDNASGDQTPAALRERWPRVHLIEPGRNVGFAAANNLVRSTDLASSRGPPEAADPTAGTGGRLGGPARRTAHANPARRRLGERSVSDGPPRRRGGDGSARRTVLPLRGGRRFLCSTARSWQARALRST